MNLNQSFFSNILFYPDIIIVWLTCSWQHDLVGGWRMEFQIKGWSWDFFFTVINIVR